MADQDVERQRIRHLRVDRHVTRSGARPPGIGTLAIPRHDPHAVRTVSTIAGATLRHASRPIEMLGSRFTVPVLQLGSRRPVHRAAHTTAAATGCSRCRRPAGRAGCRGRRPKRRRSLRHRGIGSAHQLRKRLWRQHIRGERLHIDTLHTRRRDPVTQPGSWLPYENNVSREKMPGTVVSLYPPGGWSRGSE